MVIGVIAIVSALLLPVLRDARSTARSTICQSNLKQLGIAIQLYHSMWECFPAHEWENHSPSAQSGIPRQGKSGGVGRDAAPDNGDLQSPLRWFSQLDQMLDLGEEVQKCPCTPDWVCGCNNSYGYNYKYLGSARRHGDHGFERFPVKEVANPSHTIAFGDSGGTGTEGPYEPVPSKQRGSALSYEVRKNRVGNQGYLLDPPYIPKRARGCANGHVYADRDSPSFIAPRHDGKANVCMVDGHVEALRPGDVYVDNRWWNGYGSEHPRDDHVKDKIPGLERRWQ